MASTVHDPQASPLTYRAWGPQFRVGVDHRLPWNLNANVADHSLVRGFFERGTRVTTPRGHQAVRLEGRIQHSPDGGQRLQPFVEGELSLVADRSPEPPLRTRALLVVGLGPVPMEAAP